MNEMKKAGAKAPTKRQKNYNPKDTILSILRKNRQGISRSELKELMHMDDRSIREYISELRDEGHMIGVAANGGYSINKVGDFDRAIAIYETRTRKEEKRLRAMKRTRELRDQISM